ncbi:MAG TPA: proline--tRNA ligase [Gaiellales bacterium]|nr:proline--tRNA ligase [Gaiellales bacterium]
MNAQSLPARADDFPAWYAEVVRRADLAEHSPVRGAMIIRPYGYALWEAIQRRLDDRIKATGHENVYFPLFVPEKLLEREQELLEGFAPEVAVVTHAGGKELAERLVVRPTSESMIWATYARWVRSYRDLPLLYNQWANVVRWELRPRLFLRTSEFLWQEGHTAHETAEEARIEVLRVVDEVYAETFERDLAMPVLRGRKSPSERFPGAEETFTLEALMGDGKALQAATSHDLGQNFARAYGVRFAGRDGQLHHAYAASWGTSTRVVGGLIMCHGDDRGLRLPPAVAPVQAVIVPIPDAGGEVQEAAAGLAEQLAGEGVRIRLDAREDVRPGAKFHEWEVKGVPVRLELGGRDLAAGTASLVRRDGGERTALPLETAAGAVTDVLDHIQHALHQRALEFREQHTLRDPASYGELREFLAAAGGFAEAPWCGSEECEQRLKADARATIRCLLDSPPGGSCTVCGGAGGERAVWAQSY